MKNIISKKKIRPRGPEPPPHLGLALVLMEAFRFQICSFFIVTIKLSTHITKKK